MSSSPPPSNLSRLATQLIQNVQARMIRAGARVPRLIVKDGDGRIMGQHPLMADYYTGGRSRKHPIHIPEQTVSSYHFSLQKDPTYPQCFIIKDEKSSNGIYHCNHQVKSLKLRHGDQVTLGPAQLINAITLTFHNPPPPWVQGLRYGLWTLGATTTAITLTLGSLWLKYDVARIPDSIAKPVVIYARDDKTPLRQLSANSHQELDRLKNFSPYLVQALIASEDSRFYWHPGVDPIGLARIVKVRLQSGEFSQGASTLTQQVARSLYPDVGRENNLGRKIREMVVATGLETFHSKNTILLTYLNRVFLGYGNYGFEDAAQFYFGKSAGKLDLAEAATLVASLPAPNRYNPIVNPDLSQQQRNLVLGRMVKLGMISDREEGLAKVQRLKINPAAKKILSSTKAPYFYDYAIAELDRLFQGELLKEGNFIVETTLDLKTQQAAEEAITTQLPERQNRNLNQGAIVALDRRSGAIRSMVGGINYGDSQFNRAADAKRQPGSTFKAFAYAAALEERGITPATPYNCSGLFWTRQFKPCERSGNAPTITMGQGFARSENSVALRVAQGIGLNNVVAMAQRLGITSNLGDPDPGIVLGSKEVSVLEITAAYIPFFNQGQGVNQEQSIRAYAIERVRDSTNCLDIEDLTTCPVIYDATDEYGLEPLISPLVAQQMATMMTEVVRSGTGKAADSSRLSGEAGKTGTTNQNVDTWFVGFAPSLDLVTGVWLGNDESRATSGGSADAAKVWKNFNENLIRK